MKLFKERQASSSLKIKFGFDEHLLYKDYKSLLSGDSTKYDIGDYISWKNDIKKSFLKMERSRLENFIWYLDSRYKSTHVFNRFQDRILSASLGAIIALVIDSIIKISSIEFTDNVWLNPIIEALVSIGIVLFVSYFLFMLLRDSEEYDNKNQFFYDIREIMMEVLEEK